jgi:hypothetical protein
MINSTSLNEAHYSQVLLYNEYKMKDSFYFQVLYIKYDWDEKKLYPLKKHQLKLQALFVATPITCSNDFFNRK